jgi:type II secretory pathway predicted ATPase ExeA
VRHFLERTSEQLNVAYVTNAYPGFGPLLPWLMESLNLEVAAGTPSELYRRFVTHVKQVYSKGVRTVLVIDEAQNLGVEGLEELRVLSNLNAGKDLPLQTVLIGQPELRQTLRLQNLRQFAQRIVIDHHLEALNLEETIGYVRHRLAVAGGKSDLFQPEALQRIYESTCGVPRLVNLICDTALVYGFSDQRPIIAVDLVDQVIADRTSGGLLPLRAAGTSAQGAQAIA